jgi:hypothetical protein
MPAGFFTAAKFLAALCAQLPTQCEQDGPRMANIAVAAEQAQTELAPKWRRNGKLMSAAIITAIVNESGGKRGVHDGTVRSRTRDICLMQINPGNGTWKKHSPSFEQLAGTSVEATTRCILTGLHTLISSDRHCQRHHYKTNWAEAMWSVYGNGHHCWKTRSRFKRANMTKRIAWSNPTPTREHERLAMESRLSIGEQMTDPDSLAFPLKWPVGWKRTPQHKRAQSRYQVTFAKGRDELLKELRLFGAKNITISTDIPVRRDGLPFVNARDPQDPGVAVYWQDRKGNARVMACDAWKTLRENVRALHQSISALRTIERAKAGEVLGRAFDGFKALPAAGETDAALMVDWREPLELMSMRVEEIDQAALDGAFRAAAHKAHPDTNAGSMGAWNRLQAAYAAGKAQLR